MIFIFIPQRLVSSVLWLKVTQTAKVTTSGVMCYCCELGFKPSPAKLLCFKTTTSWTFFKEVKRVKPGIFIYYLLAAVPLTTRPLRPPTLTFFSFQYQAQQQQEIADYENNRILYCSNHTGENSFGSVAARMAFVMSDWVRILSRC